MSYILDALRKSEQQRQATQPDNVTDRILVNQPPPKPRRKRWLLVLVLSNCLAIAGLAWYFGNKTGDKTSIKQTTLRNQVASPAPSTQTRQPNQQPANLATAPLATPEPSLSTTASPSIAQLMQQSKADESPKPAKRIPDKKTIAVPVKKESANKTASNKQLGRADFLADRPVLPATPEPSTPDLKELTNNERGNLPDLNINVYSYDHNPKDRFVIIDMVKYKTGQMVKGQAKLKEIRSDSIVLENSNGKTFTVPRP